MNGRLRKAFAVFVSAAVVGAGGIALLATPAGAASSPCETFCTVGSATAPLAFGPAPGPVALGLKFSTDISGYVYDICYQVAPGETTNDPVELYDNGGTAIASGVASASGPYGCLIFGAGVPIGPGTYTAAYQDAVAFDYNTSNPAVGTPDLTPLAGVYQYPGGFPSLTVGNDYGIQVDFMTPSSTPVITSATTTNGLAPINVAVTGDGQSGSSITVTCTSIYDGESHSATIPPATSPVQIAGFTTPKNTGDLTHITDTVVCSAVEFTSFGIPSAAAVTDWILIGPNTAGVLRGDCGGATLTAPTQVSAASESFPGAVVSWAPATSDPAGCIAGYVVTPFQGTTALPPTIVTGLNTTTIVQGLTNGSTYTFTIAAENGQTVGPASSATPAVTIGVPGAASALKVARVAKGAIRVAFKPAKGNGSPIAKYTATCKSYGGTTRSASGKSSPITVTRLSAKSVYTCSVTATNSVGTGATSRLSAQIKA